MRFTPHRCGSLAMAAILLSVVSCRDASHGVTGPLRGPPVLPSASHAPTVASSDPLSTVLSSTVGSCLFAIRVADGQYVARSAAVALPQAVIRGRTSTERSAYRGWVTGVAQPAQLAVCTIPATAAARDFMGRYFGSTAISTSSLQLLGASQGMTGAIQWNAQTSRSPD